MQNGFKKKTKKSLISSATVTVCLREGRTVERSWPRLRPLHKWPVGFSHTKCMGVRFSALTLHSCLMITHWRHPCKQPQRDCVSERRLNLPYKVNKNFKNNSGRFDPGNFYFEDFAVQSEAKKGPSVLQGDTQSSITDTLEWMLCAGLRGKTLIHPAVFSFLHTESSEPAAPANGTLRGSHSKQPS